jgi:hypothetical protein
LDSLAEGLWLSLSYNEEQEDQYQATWAENIASDFACLNWIDVDPTIAVFPYRGTNEDDYDFLERTDRRIMMLKMKGWFGKIMTRRYANYYGYCAVAHLCVEDKVTLNRGG